MKLNIYAVKEKKIPKYIIEDTEISSNCDRKISDEENSDEESFDKENSDDENYDEENFNK